MLVLHILNRNNIVWGQCNETLLDKLQTLQYKAARTIAKIRYDDANHMKLLCDFGWISVRNLINFDLAVFMYNTQRGFAPDNIKDLFQTVDAVHSYKTRAASDGKLHAVHTNLGITQRSISCSGVKIWNDLPKSIRDAQSIDVFKKRLKEHRTENIDINVHICKFFTNFLCNFQLILLLSISLSLFSLSRYFR